MNWGRITPLKVYLKFLNSSNFRSTCPIWMNDPSLESYYVGVFKYCAFDHLSCNIYTDVSTFSSISEKVHQVTCAMWHEKRHTSFLFYNSHVDINLWHTCTEQVNHLVNKLITEQVNYLPLSSIKINFR